MPTYYFDPTASASTGAGTQANPFRTQAEISAGVAIGPDNALLFRRGTVWRPGLRTNSGNSDFWLIPPDFLSRNNVTLGAYGTGAKPVIDGSITLGGWTAVGGHSNLYQCSIPGLSAQWHRPGNIWQNDAAPYFVRWQGSVAATMAVVGSRPFAQFCDFGASVWYIRTPDNPNTTPVSASYWRWLLHNEQNAVKRTGVRMENLAVQGFSSNPWILYGMEGMVIAGCEGRFIGGLFRPDQDFYEGNWIDIREGNDGMVIEECVIEDIFDAGISPQFASQWGAPGGWTTLTNVTIRNNIIRRCGLAGVENVIQQPTGDRIDGVYIEGNTFEECGKGPFGDGSTWGGGGAAVNSGQNGGGSQSALTTNVHVRYNRVINCQVVNGDFKGPAQHFVYGNVCTMDPAFARPQDIAVRAGWTVSHVEPGPQRMRVFGNVFVGYPTAIAVNVASFAIEVFARYNTIVNCGTALQGNGLSNITARISNNTIHNVPTAAAGWGNSSFASQGGNRLSSVTTNGFTLLGSDQSGQSAPAFAPESYRPVPGSPLLSGGVTGFAEYGDPLRLLFSTNATTRNAYTTGTNDANAGGSWPTGGSGGGGGGGGGVTIAPDAPTNVSATSFTLSATIAGTPPAGSVMLLQWTDNPLAGPWRDSHPEGSRPTAVEGVFSHSFVGAPAATQITWRAFVFTDVQPATIHAQTPNQTFSTSSASLAYQVELPAAQFAVGIAGLNVAVWRNVDWWTAVPEWYVVSAPTVIPKPGDATRNLLRVPAPVGAATGDTVTTIVLQPSTGLRAGPGAAAVVAA
jgi:hypothetical protein